MHSNTYPVGVKWNIMAPVVASENIVYRVAKENPNIGILLKFIYVSAQLVLVKLVVA